MLLRIAIIALTTLLVSSVSGTVPTAVDTVLVPPNLLSLVSTTTDTSGVVRTFSGVVRYDIATGDNDSLLIGLSFTPVGSGAAVTVTSVAGDAGTRTIVTGWNGRKQIRFTCRITGTPAAQYQAVITVQAVAGALEKRVDSLLALMTLQEKVDQLHGTGTGSYSTLDNSRLGIPGFKMSDGPMGVGEAGSATCLPTSMAEGCTWDTAMVYQVGAAMGQEFRALGTYVALGPMVNLVRNTQGGRDFETYGEDPYLTGALAAADIRGLQSVKTIATPKHLCCNDRENSRNTYSADVSERTLREIYALPFEKAIKEGGAWSIMSAYNRVNSTYSSENTHLLTDLLKNGWGFRGFEMSDWDGTHSTVAAADAGHDVEMPDAIYFGAALSSAVSAGQVSTATLDDKVRRVLRAKAWAGVLDAPITQFQSLLRSAQHDTIARQAARESIVLVKNAGNILPLSTSVNTVALVGLFADSARLCGGGSGEVYPPYTISLRQGIINKVGAAKITTDYAHADVAIVVVGPADDHEFSDRCTNTLSGSTCASIYTWFGDQNAYAQQVIAANPKTIVVYLGGSPVISEQWTSAPAIVVAFYPGQEQGNALADVLFGDYNPGGKLCVSWPAANQFVNWDEVNSDAIGPHITYETADVGPGYRFLDRNGYTPTWPFGYGLSYTTFTYSNLRLSASSIYAGDSLTVQADITNSGARAGDEVAELYLAPAGASNRPIKELRGFARVNLQPGATTTVVFALGERDFTCWHDTPGAWLVDTGNFQVEVGRSSADLPLTQTVSVLP